MKKILLVDDDPRNVFALKMVLRTRGYECLVAQSGSEALSLVDSSADIGVVLMDMMMPDMDGYEAMAALRTREPAKQPPVIAVTAQAMKGDREKCLDAGAVAYVSKPVDIDVLLPLLHDFIGQANGS